jgi:hypothetical protein
MHHGLEDFGLLGREIRKLLAQEARDKVRHNLFLFVDLLHVACSVFTVLDESPVYCMSRAVAQDGRQRL